MKSLAAEKLKELRVKTGFSVREVAKHLGYAYGSGYQHFEDVYTKEFLPYDLVQKLIPLFVPKGVEAKELLALAGADYEPQANQSEVRALITEIRDEMERDLGKLTVMLERLDKAAR